MSSVFPGSGGLSTGRRCGLPKFAVLGGVILLGSFSALAVPQLTIHSGATTISLTDNQYDGLGGLPDDSWSSDDGVVGWSGSIGNFTLTTETGYTKPYQGSEGQPDLHLDVVAGSKAAGTLTVTFTDTGFTGSPLGLIASFGGVFGNIGASAVFKTLVNGQELTKITAGPGGLALPGEEALAMINLATPYTLSLVVELTTTGKTPTSSLNSSLTAAPEGGATVILLGLAFLGIAGMSRSTRNRVAAC